MAKILIVEDNQGTNKAICEYMKEAGHTLFSAFTGSEALKIFREKELDIIVLDIMLPEMSGIVVLHEIRKISNIPVIMLTALDDEYTQSNSFDEMADDYITKPFSMLILGKRITALLRRSQNKPAVNTVKLGDITVDFSGYTASDENGKIDITPKELEILKVLIDNKGLVLSRNQILDEVWGYDCDVIDRTPRSIMYFENRGQHPSLNTFYKIVTLLDISVDQFFYPDKQNEESDCRQHIDRMLNTMDENELTIMEATAEGIQKARETEGA